MRRRTVGTAMLAGIATVLALRAAAGSPPPLAVTPATGVLGLATQAPVFHDDIPVARRSHAALALTAPTPTPVPARPLQQAPAPPPSTAPPAPARAGCGSATASRTLSLVNGDRQAAGLAPLSLDPGLCSAALMHVVANAQRDTMTHDGLFDAVSRAAVSYHALGEVLGSCRPLDPGYINSLWLQSAEHHSIIDGSQYVRVGIAWAQSAGGTWYVSAIVDG